MEGTRKIMRRSIYNFLQNYQNFTTIAALIAFPFSVSVLLSQSFVVPSSSSSSSIHNRLRALFEAAGVPGSSQPFTILIHKLSQTISSSIFTLPFSLTFFLISKAYVIQTLHQNKPTLLLYKPLFVTHLCNLFIVISANATSLSVFFLGFNLVQETLVSSPNWVFILSATGAVIYSVILANTVVVFKLALVLSVIEGCGGWIAILKALVLMRGRTTTALSLALPVSMVLAGIEALFQYRIVRGGDRSYGHASTPAAMAVEGMLIAYLYSIFVVLDTVVNYMFLKSCMRMVEQEAMNSYRIGFIEQESDVGLVAYHLERKPTSRIAKPRC
ncbi:hypothetical protein HS088_TW16G00564 [Tripterygium wilfordii]|uniref:Transmembrane protein n=1 Tax=Tripterygium wilfordii TaxID=458696 RepID=A0A7J7CJ80_TRIWF|nr:uncharacterized protein LOC119980695 [Tripterygium wilfordii]KAF5734122.1 hypothetical protein HS088_TW16G00564 [Tripterygium wilfordii]